MTGHASKASRIYCLTADPELCTSQMCIGAGQGAAPAARTRQHWPCTACPRQSLQGVAYHMDMTRFAWQHKMPASVIHHVLANVRRCCATCSRLIIMTWCAYAHILHCKHMPALIMLDHINRTAASLRKLTCGVAGDHCCATRRRCASHAMHIASPAGEQAHST